MTRIGFVAAAIAVAAMAGPAVAQGVVDGPKVAWKLATWGKPRAFTVGIETVKKHVETRSGGKFTITIGYESFGGPKELLDLLKVGALQATTMCSSYHPDKHPAYTALDLPFLPLPDADAQQRVHEAFHAHPFIQKEMAGWNGQFYMSGLLPQYEFIGRGNPPKTIADFKGMRVRAIGGIGDAMKRLGAVPTSVDATEVYTSMERGTVDAASFPSTYAHGSYKTYEVGKWFTENMAPGTQACPTLFNIDAFKALPDAYKALFDEAKPLAYDNLKAAYKEADDKFIPLFKKARLSFVRFGDAELAEFRRVGAKPVWDEWVAQMAARGIPAQELLDLILKSAEAKGSGARS
ncbi:MAG: C4-dicarboxylate ABC transporter substrate-binding protein [Alphaproteobacteria bacterium]|nr:C4-dicarboxylate ABC transporter substrate-binding protein [Alphaproteobacteria bacterium]